MPARSPVPLALHVRPARAALAGGLAGWRAPPRSRSREQLSIKTKERDGRSPLPLAGRPVCAARQFSFELWPSRLSAASSRPKFTAAKGFSFVPISEDPALVLCFRARTATNLGLLRSRTASSVRYCIEILEIVQNFVTATLRNACAGPFE